MCEYVALGAVAAVIASITSITSETTAREVSKCDDLSVFFKNHCGKSVSPTMEGFCQNQRTAVDLCYSEAGSSFLHTAVYGISYLIASVIGISLLSAFMQGAAQVRLPTQHAIAIGNTTIFLPEPRRQDTQTRSDNGAL